MADRLIEQVRRVRRRAMRLVLAKALCATAAVALAGFVLAASVDYLLQVQDQGIRMFLSQAVVVVTLVALYWFGWPALRLHWSEVDVARRIERRFPQLQDRLSTSIAFLHEKAEHPAAGSVGLRRAVISQTQDEVQRLDFSRVTDPRPAQRTALVMVSLLLAAAAITWWQPATASLATKRLLMPWSQVSWPRTNHLMFHDPPSTIAVGEDLELTVVDQNGRTPESVTVYYWYEGAPRRSMEDYGMEFRGGGFVHRLPEVTRDLRFRAAGGDDTSMPWHMVRVVPPPRIQSLAITLIPPTYTGWPVQVTQNPLRALEGTQIGFVGRSSKPLDRAMVTISSAGRQRRMEGALGQGGQSFRIPGQQGDPWVIDATSAYQVALVDTDGVRASTDPPREIRCVPDHPPTVQLEFPPDGLMVTSRAVVPVRGDVADDLRIRSIDLRYRRSGSDQEIARLIELFQDPPDAKGRSLVDETVRLAPVGPPREIDFAWDLSTVPRLAPGVTLVVEVAAADYKSQEGISDPRRLAVVTADEFDRWIAQQQSRVVEQLRTTVQLQKEVLRQLDELQYGMRGPVGADRLVDELVRVQVRQRDVRRRISQGDESIVGAIDTILMHLRINLATGSERYRSLEAASRALATLHHQQLERIDLSLQLAIQKAGQNLDRAGRAADPDSRPDDEASTVSAAALPAGPDEQPLRVARDCQQQVIDRLQQLLEQLVVWEDLQQVVVELRRLRDDQDDLARQCLSLLAETLGREVGALESGETNRLDRLSQRQRELARRMDDLIGRLQSLRQSLSAQDAPLAATVAEALSVSGRRDLSGRMRQSAQNVQDNRLAKARQYHEDLQAGFAELLNLLGQLHDRGLETQADGLRRAAGELAGLRREQVRLQAAIREDDEGPSGTARPATQRIADQQYEVLVSRLQELAKTLQHLDALRAGNGVTAAAMQLQQAQQSRFEGELDTARGQSQAASRQLAQAQRELQQRIRQIETELARQRLAAMRQQLQPVISQQGQLLEVTSQLDRTRQQQGQFTAAEEEKIRSVAKRQEELSDATEEIARQAEPLPVFRIALSGARERMLAVVQRLNEQHTGDATQQIQSDILERLQQVAEAASVADQQLNQRPDQTADAGPEQNQSADNRAPLGPSELAQLRLLQQMQMQVYRQTAALDHSRQTSQGKLPEAQRQKLQNLIQEQGELAELIVKLKGDQ